MQSPTKSSFKHLILAGLLASIGVVASAQDTTTSTTPSAADKTAPAHARHGDRERMGRHDPAQMKAFMAKHMAALKEKLKLTSAQEPAWSTFTSSMQPPAQPARPERGEMAKLTTPERIDKMRAMRAQRDAEMDKRGEATKTFYTVLTPEQQKVFDTNAMPRRPGGPGERPHGGPDAPPSKG